jgi:predicted anti-sigma-YlaC factor YlaD
MKQKDAGCDLHERAHRLIDMERVEGLPVEERRWLDAHLADCEACAGWAEAAEVALRSFRSVSVVPPRGLAALTSLRVREKTAELKQERTRNIALIVGCALSWLTGVASAPLVWKLCAWLGSMLDLPRLVWQAGFVLWWFVPAAAAGLLIVWRMRAEREPLKDWGT